MASPCWQQLAAQHGVSTADGTLVAAEGGDAATRADDAVHRSQVFRETAAGKWVPRAVLVDSDPWMPAVVKRTSCAKLFAPWSIVAGKRDCQANAACGMYTFGNDFWKASVEDSLRRALEACDTLDTVLLYHSVCGGTGSGMSRKMYNGGLNALAPKALLTSVATIPSPQLTTTNLESTNAVLGVAFSLIQGSHLSFCVQTQAAMEYVKRHPHAAPAGDKPLTNEALNGIAAAAINMQHHAHRTPGAPLARSMFELRDFLCADGASHLATPGVRWGTPDRLEALTAEAADASGRLLAAPEPPKDGAKADEDANDLKPTGGLALSFGGEVDAKQALSATSALKAQWPDSPPFGAAAIGGGCTVAVPGTEPGVACVASAQSLPPTLRAALRRVRETHARSWMTRAFAHHFVAEGMEEGELVEAQDVIDQHLKTC
eukprot:CAMPEP_0174855818 /NCGR_PEP_ID=MMETSP1114-20130205/34312_1 /TAXON_ID=312471 /ORGANISM="Neobodo designis, Strain CCAP 1951/1" /LENGTH=431 /DNA_ID=CAMNT_0016090585 /DNA_START=85 /DNA_END=1380 /DNA_ORIENTATION=+